LGLAIAFGAASWTAVSPSAHAARGDCSQPVTDGSTPLATDCLFVLRVAVSLATCDPECVCAPKGSLPVVATDALVCLRSATGQSVALLCPCPTTTTTTTTTVTTTTTLGPPACGEVELCDPRNNVAYDDDCDGEVDEDPLCTCVPGTAQGCFKGDPTYLAQFDECWHLRPIRPVSSSSWV
jgi:hypothetical protein